MTGAMFSSGLNIETGPGKSRNAAGDPHPTQSPFDADSSDAKYAIGSLSQGIILRPGVLGGATITGGLDRGDSYSAIGVVGVGQVSPYDLDDHESTGSGVAYDRIWASAVAGAEFIAQVGRRTPREGTFADAGKGELDLRELFLKEEDDWEVQTVGIGNLIGATTSAVMDTRKSATSRPSNFSFPSCGPQNLGAIQVAVGQKSILAAAVKDSWVNVANSANYYAVNSYREHWKKFLNHANCTDDRPGSSIRSIFGLYVDRPDMGARSESGWIDVGRGIGVFIDEFQPELLAGSSGLPAPYVLLCDEDWENECYEDHIAYQEQGASLVTRGAVVVGDDISDEEITGWNTDMVHIEGALRLRGRSSHDGPPLPDCCLPPSFREGVLYYDSTNQKLRLGILGPYNETNWVALQLDTNDVIAGEQCPEPARPGRELPKNRTDRIKAQRDEMEEGSSPRISPKVQVLPVARSEGGSLTPPTVLVTGFMHQTPSFYWLRVGNEGSLSPEVEWKRVPDEFVEPVSGLSDYADAFSIFYPFDEPGPAGHSADDGDTVQLLALSRIDGRTAGVTFRIP